MAWLAAQRVSLGFTTGRAGRLVLVGHQPDGHPAVVEAPFDRTLGLAADPDGLYVASGYQLWRLENVLDARPADGGPDRFFIPQVAWTTGDIGIHDVAAVDGHALFASSLFGCFGAPSEHYSLVPRWVPPFITQLAPEDRCHLNGIAVHDAEPRYATALGEADAAGGWQESAAAGGIVLDVAEREVVARELSLPNSPRMHRGRLWLLESGTGRLGFVDPARGKFEAVADLPGFPRGLALIGHFAVVGLGSLRENAPAELPLRSRLEAAGETAHCGIVVVDLRGGRIVHALTIERGTDEVHSVVILPGVARPAAIGPTGAGIQRVLRIGPMAEAAVLEREKHG